jgi:hypothetical protein
MAFPVGLTSGTSLRIRWTDRRRVRRIPGRATEAEPWAAHVPQKRFGLFECHGTGNTAQGQSLTDTGGRVHTKVKNGMGSGVSRRVWVVSAGAAYWLCAAIGVGYLLRQGVTPGNVLALHALCLAVEAVSVLGVLWPGPQAGSEQLVDDHQSVTVSALCGSVLLLVLPAVLVLSVLGRTGPPVQAVLLSASALVLASSVGLVAVTALAHAVRPTGGGPGPLDGPDWSDTGDFASHDE